MEATADFQEPVYAGFWRRIIVVLIDGVIVLTVPAAYFFVAIFFFSPNSVTYVTAEMSVEEHFEAKARFDSDVEKHVISQLLYAIGPVWETVRFFYTVTFWTWRGQTRAMIPLGVKIIGVDGSATRLHESVLRYFGTILSMLLAFLGYFMIVWDRRKQGLHDKIAKTLDVRTS